MTVGFDHVDFVGFEYCQLSKFRESGVGFYILFINCDIYCILSTN